jgi:branched-chain amino acid aminotransferase
MSIKFIRTSENKAKPRHNEPLFFGQYFTDHMFMMEYHQEQGWHDARMQPYQPFIMDPASLCFHYGQTLFEGMKAYRNRKDEILLFRPEEHLKRMQNGCRRLCIPLFDRETVLKGLIQLLKIEKDWIPKIKNSSLYIRPTIIATQPILGVQTSKEYYLYIILSPVDSFYKSGFSAVDIHVESQFIRAAVGGVGNVKAGGNYAASFLAANQAKKDGFAQVLWLDAREKRYIEEVGAMNIFFVIDNEVITPALTGSILPGITRDTVIQIFKQWNIPVYERPITIDEVIARCRSNRLTEVFGTGTAAIVTPVAAFGYQNEKYTVNQRKMGSITARLFDYLSKLQRNETDDPKGWVYKIQE